MACGLRLRTHAETDKRGRKQERGRTRSPPGIFFCPSLNGMNCTLIPFDASGAHVLGGGVRTASVALGPARSFLRTPHFFWNSVRGLQRRFRIVGRIPAAHVAQRSKRPKHRERNAAGEAMPPGQGPLTGPTAPGLRARLVVLPLSRRQPSPQRRFPMTARSWIRKLFARTPRTARKARFRPRLEQLEVRALPAAVVAKPDTFSAV